MIEEIWRCKYCGKTFVAPYVAGKAAIDKTAKAFTESDQEFIRGANNRAVFHKCAEPGVIGVAGIVAYKNTDSVNPL